MRATLAASGLPPVFDLVFSPVGEPAEARARRVPGGLRGPRRRARRGRRVRGLAAGRRCGRAAGMFVIAVPSDGVHELEADLVLGSLLDLDLAVLGL